MTDDDFSMALTVTFIPYILVELPSNLLLHRIGAGIQIPFLVSVWGLITCLQGLVTSYSGLLAARFCLGLIEGGLYPAMVLYLSMFYTRTELQLRIALFFCTSCLSGAMSGLLTYTIMKLDGFLDRSGWSWVFLIEGFVTAIIGLLGFFILPSTIDKARFLSASEKSVFISRKKSDAGPAFVPSKATADKPRSQPISFQVWQAMKSPHVILLSVAHFMCGANIYSLAYFTPTIVNSFGYSPSQTQLFIVPPYAVAFLFILTLSYYSDRYQARAITTVICAVLSVAGLSVFCASDAEAVRYGSLFLSVSGVYGASPCLAAWMATNSEPMGRKATTLALGPSLANLGGLASVWIFVLGDKPRYTIPTALSIVFAIVIIICSLLNVWWLTHAQRVKAERKAEILAEFQLLDDKMDVMDDYSSEKGLRGSRNRHADSIAHAWDRLGDRHPDFKYTF